MTGLAAGGGVLRGSPQTTSHPWLSGRFSMKDESLQTSASILIHNLRVYVWQSRGGGSPVGVLSSTAPLSSLLRRLAGRSTTRTGFLAYCSQLQACVLSVSAAGVFATERRPRSTQE